jgi:hypothetical protein
MHHLYLQWYINKKINSLLIEHHNLKKYASLKKLIKDLEWMTLWLTRQNQKVNSLAGNYFNWDVYYWKK